MFSRYATSLAALTTFAALQTSSAISTISAVGSKFFTSDGDQFFIKGVAYQLTPHDPLIDTEQCQLDSSLMKQLGANAIRVYHVDPTGDHNGCMSAFADAGIYLFVDLDTFTTAIYQDEPYWNETQLNDYKKVLDEFQQYDNVAGVFVGNEVVDAANGSDASPYIKAATRDVKAYRDSKGYRQIPVGYSAADISELRPMLQNYLTCGGNSSENIDFFSLNAYEWCGDATFTTSGYSQLQAAAQNYPIPIFFSETGCNTVPPRTFEDQAAILGPEMDNTWSGAIIYEWLEEANNYGLISYGPPAAATATGAVGGYTRSGTPTPVSPDFTNLQNQWATLTPSGVKLSDYSASASALSAPPCPMSSAGGWLVQGNPALPTLGQTLDRADTTTAGSAGTAGATGTGTGTGTATGSAATASSSSASGSTNSKPNSTSGGREIAGMSIALVAVMLGFVIWL
ncbi:hypothetical protein MMC25_007928 [Agyrium rufum]|nr:hypothetical protein [Agyrium rufum]